MAFPTTGILDSFTSGPTEDPLSRGGNFADMNIGLDLRLNTASGAFFVNGQNNSSTPSTRYWAASSFGPDTEVYVTCILLPGGSNYIRLYLRIQNAGAGASQNSYFMQWANDANGCRIFKEVSGTPTSLAQSAAATFAANDQIGFEAVGTALTVYKNGASVVTTTDSTYTTGGNIGLAIRDSTGRLTQFGGGTVVAAATYVPRVVIF